MTTKALRSTILLPVFIAVVFHYSPFSDEVEQ